MIISKGLCSVANINSINNGISSFIAYLATKGDMIEFTFFTIYYIAFNHSTNKQYVYIYFRLGWVEIYMRLIRRSSRKNCRGKSTQILGYLPKNSHQCD